MDNDYKKVLYINFDALTFEFKIHEDLYSYVGGMGVGHKILFDNIDLPVIVLSTGPLSGYFPYVSKANLSYINKNKIVDMYGGGNIASLMNMSHIDAIVITKDDSSYVHADIFSQDISFSVYEKREFEKMSADFAFDETGACSQNYFSFGGLSGINPFKNGGCSISIKSTESIDLIDFFEYEKLYEKALNDYRLVTEEPRNNPSCLGCPLGCDKSNLGEEDSNIAVCPELFPDVLSNWLLPYQELLFPALQ